MPSQTEIRQQVTQQIITALEPNLLPWRRPWRATTASAGQPARHSNVASRQAYRGVNPSVARTPRHAARSDLTMVGARSRCGRASGCDISKRPAGVEEGHWGCRVVFWKPLTKAVVDDPIADEEEEERRLRAADVHHILCRPGRGCRGFPGTRRRGQTDEQPDFAPAEELISATGADIRYGGDRALLPSGRRLHRPVRRRRRSTCRVAFWETACHESAHWSEPRTGWDHKKNGYALGELVAEIASCYVSQELGIPQGETLGNHAAYLKSWLEALRNDRSCIFKATKQAGKVTDFLLGFVRKAEPQTAGATA